MSRTQTIRSEAMRSSEQLIDQGPSDSQTMDKLTQRARYPQPFLKWAGGKSQLLRQMSGFLPRHFNRYFEPFVGGGAVFFYLRPRSGMISDANFELINAYRVIKNDPDSLIKELDKLQERRISQTLYAYYRSMNPEKLPTTKRAVRLIFLNKTCYNGLYRVNQKGEFNVPFGKYARMPRLYDRTNLMEIHKALQSIEIMCATYEIALEHATQGDFLYIDPPYAPERSESPSFTAYTRESFTLIDQKRLATKVAELDRRGCLLMLSNSNTTLVRDLYSNYALTRLKVGRMINCIGSERMGYDELLIRNYKIPMETLSPWVDKPS